MTMLDPFYYKYGKGLTSALALVSLFTDLVWVPATLLGLGMSFFAFHMYMYKHQQLYC